MGIKAQREILDVYLLQWGLSSHRAVASYILLMIKYLQKSVLILFWASILSLFLWLREGFVLRRGDTGTVDSTVLLILWFLS